MSFEGVFEKWLSKKNMEVWNREAGRTEKECHQEGDCQATEEAALDRDMPVIQQEVWRDSDMDDMPVLQRMVDLPSVPSDRQLGSPPPPPLQITLSLANAPSKYGRCSRKDGDMEKLSQAGGHESFGSQLHLQKKSHKHKKHRKTSFRVHEKNSDYDSGSNTSTEHTHLKHRNSHQCHAKSALTELTDLNHGSSPSVARGIEGDPVLSPEQDMPMEPDSTSEFVVRWRHARKERETSRGEISPFGEVSPQSIGCVGHTTPTTRVGPVHTEENLAECDSTSMFITSPSAISPASLGEIEERVCPVIDRDEKSPAHCVCRCRSLPPSPNLLTRNYAHLTATTKSVSAPVTARSSLPRVQTDLVRCHSVDDEPAPNLEKMAPCLELMAPPRDVFQGENDSPPVLTLPEEEIQRQPFRTQHSTPADIPVEENQQEAPALIKYGAESTPRSSRNSSSCDDSEKSPPVLSLLEQESSKPSKSADLLDFTNNIDWDTAVAETVIGPPTVEQNGEKKPAIVIKIRTKTIMPQVKASVKGKPVENPSRSERKRKTVDNSEIISRLRKRHKPKEMSTQTEVSEVNSPQLHCMDCNVSRTQADSKNCSCSHFHQPTTQAKRQQRNTLQVGEDFKAHTQHLSPTDRSVVQAFVDLFRLQSLTHVLMRTVFPRLKDELSVITPESPRFTQVIDDIILSLQQSECESFAKECEDMNGMFEKLTVGGDLCVPIFFPRVKLCCSSQKMLQNFRDKVSRLLQLLLPDLVVSFTEIVSDSSRQLEDILKKVIAANRLKASTSRKKKS